jgi:hypothetical protein
MNVGRPVVAGVLAAVLVLAAACTGHRAKAPGLTADVPPGGTTVTAGQFTIALPAGTVARTTRVTVKDVTAAPSDGAATILRPLTRQVDVRLDQGAQPARPVTVTATPADRAAATAARPGTLMLLSRDGRTQAWSLSPAAYDANRGLLSATVGHFSVFGFVTVDVSGPYHQMLDLVKAMFALDGAAKPGCAGQPFKAGGVTYTLDKSYQGRGDGIIWPCLARRSGGKIELTLANATGLPWLIRSRPAAEVTDPGTIDVNKAVLMAFYQQFLDGGRFAQSMVLPGVTKTYTFAANTLPGYVDLELDGFAQQAMALIWALRFVLDLFYPEARVATALTKVDFIGCIGDLVDTQTAGFTATGAGRFAKSFFDCAGPIADAMDSGVSPVSLGKVVVAALAGGVSLVLNDLIAAYRTLAGKDHTRVVVGRDAGKLALTAHGVGPLAFGSAGPTGEAALTTAFGPADKVSDGPFCALGGGDPGRLRVLTWGNLAVSFEGAQLHGKGLKLQSWQLTDGRLTAPVTLPHGLAPGATYDDLIGGESEMVDGDGVQYFFEPLVPTGTTRISAVGAGVIPCD